MTPEGYERAKALVLKSRMKLIRERRLLETLEALESRQVDDLVIELALEVASRTKATGRRNRRASPALD